MADSFQDRKVRSADGLVIVKETVTFDGTTASWVVPNGMKVIHASPETISGVGGGTATWSGSTVTLTGFTNADVILMWATCYPNHVGVIGENF